MEGSLTKFSGHIPDDILKENTYLHKLLGVLDGMLKIRKDELYNYTKSFLYPLVSDIDTMRRYVDDWGAEYTDGSSRRCLDCLYRNYSNIYSSKGTIKGIKSLLRCLLWVNHEPSVEVTNYTKGKPLLLFDDNKPYDSLVDGIDISKEINAAAGEELWCATLLDTTWEDQKGSIDITIDIDYTPNEEFIVFLKSTILLYLPMVNKDFININMSFSLMEGM